MRTTFTSLTATALLVVSALGAPMLAHAQAGGVPVISVSFQGPGGHSNSNNGRTSAVHAASRAIANLAQQTAVLPHDYSVYGFKGGNSVNSLASDAEFKVAIKGSASVAAVEEAVQAAVSAGTQAENDFRKVKEGDKVGGVAAAISYTITKE